MTLSALTFLQRSHVLEAQERPEPADDGFGFEIEFLDPTSTFEMAPEGGADAQTADALNAQAGRFKEPPVVNPDDVEIEAELEGNRQNEEACASKTVEAFTADGEESEGPKLELGQLTATYDDRYFQEMNLCAAGGPCSEEMFDKAVEFMGNVSEYVKKSTKQDLLILVKLRASDPQYISDIFDVNYVDLSAVKKNLSSYDAMIDSIYETERQKLDEEHEENLAKLEAEYQLELAAARVHRDEAIAREAALNECLVCADHLMSLHDDGTIDLNELGTQKGIITGNEERDDFMDALWKEFEKVQQCDYLTKSSATSAPICLFDGKVPENLRKVQDNIIGRLDQIEDPIAAYDEKVLELEWNYTTRDYREDDNGSKTFTLLDKLESAYEADFADLERIREEQKEGIRYLADKPFHELLSKDYEITETESIETDGSVTISRNDPLRNLCEDQFEKAYKNDICSAFVGNAGQISLLDRIKKATKAENVIVKEVVDPKADSDGLVFMAVPAGNDFASKTEFDLEEDFAGCKLPATLDSLKNVFETWLDANKDIFSYKIDFDENGGIIIDLAPVYGAKLDDVFQRLDNEFVMIINQNEEAVIALRKQLEKDACFKFADNKITIGLTLPEAWKKESHPYLTKLASRINRSLEGAKQPVDLNVRYDEFLHVLPETHMTAASGYSSYVASRFEEMNVMTNMESLKDEVGALYWSAAQYAQQNMAQRDMSKYGALLIFEFPRFKQDGTLVDDLENKANFIYDFQRFKPDGTAVDEAEGKANRSKELKETFYGSAYDKGLTPIADRIEKDGEKRCNAAIRSLDPDKDKKLIDATIDLCNERIVDAVDRAGQEVGQMIPKDIRFFTTVNDNIFIPRISIMIYNKTDFEPDTDPLGTRALYETLVEMGCLVDINGLNGECRMARSPKEPAEEKVTLK